MRVVAGLVTLLIAAGVVLIVTDPFAGSGNPPSGSTDNSYPTSTAVIAERSLSSQIQVSATLGFASSVSISLPSGTPSSAVTQAEQAAASATARVTQDEAALAKAKALSKVTNGGILAAATSAVATDKTALAAASAQLSADQQLSCPPASASTVTSGAIGSASQGSSTGAGSQKGGALLLQGQTSTLPSVVTGSPTTIGSTTATLVGTVNPAGLDASYYFEYGTTAAYGIVTATSDAGSSTSPVDVSADISGLSPNTTYAFALVATNSSGSIAGAQATFLTLQSSCVAQRAVVVASQQALAQAENTLKVDRLSEGTSVTSAQQQLSSDQAAASAATAALTDAKAQQMNPASTFTSLPAVGTDLSRGSVVYSLGNEPVPLFYGTTVFYRALYFGVSDGPDVAELQLNLVALGFGAGLTPSAHFSSATAEAIKAWQSSLGLAPTGVLALGDVVVQPGPIQVHALSATTGQQAQPGATVLTATSTKRVVTIALDSSQQSEVRVGDAVVITLPNQVTTPGVVTFVGKVATTSSSGSTTGGASSSTISVVVTPSDAAAVGNLDEAPVEVAITNASVKSALVVPVNSLVALSSGGYALEELDSSGAHHLVAVTLGIFDDADGLVQVSGSGLAAGQRVVVPAA
jgi:hypothetical protein